jgi:transaldolase
VPDPLAELSAAGVSIWLDDLNRVRLASGTLAGLIRDRHVVGVTSNPTIFAAAIAGSDLYDEQIRDLAARGVGVDEATRMITTFDVRWACDVLRPVYAATDGVDGRVSIEVDARLAHHTGNTVAEARALWWLVDRPNLFIKIPATEAGVAAIAPCLAEGISINVTLIFSLPRYAAVVDAFLDGMDRAAAAGRELSRLASVASFFVSRVDTEIDTRLDQLDTTPATALRGRAAIANAVLAFAHHDEVLASARWARLAAAGARPQRPLWASTGVKDPAYDETRYVLDLVTAGVVNTMPEATLDAVAEHGKLRGDTVRGCYVAARKTLDALTAVGIDYHRVVTTLEDEGVAKFAASGAQLATLLADRLRTPPAAQPGTTDPDAKETSPR